MVSLPYTIISPHSTCISKIRVFYYYLHFCLNLHAYITYTCSYFCMLQYKVWYTYLTYLQDINMYAYLIQLSIESTNACQYFIWYLMKHENIPICVIDSFVLISPINDDMLRQWDVYKPPAALYIYSHIYTYIYIHIYNPCPYCRDCYLTFVM